MPIAELTVRPTERLVEGPRGSAALEPLVMTLFLALAAQAERVVTRRELFSRLWGSLAVGDDNLNRLVAALRRTLTEVGSSSVRVETVPGLGYALQLGPSSSPAEAEQQSRQALVEALDSWRLGLPEPDHLRIALLSRAGEMATGDQARIFGLLALLHRHAAEYGAFERVSDHVRACETAARRSLELEPAQAEAGTALVSVAPLYGRWQEASRRLSDLCAATEGHPVPEEDLSVLEMATGQIRAAKRRRDRLLALDPLAAIFCYKSVYQHWSLGDLAGMDHAADRAIQLWPFHPAVWTARLWTLAYTDRLPAAQALLAGPPPQGMPDPMLAFLRRVLDAAAKGDASSTDEAASAAVRLAGHGPAHAVAGLFALGLLRRTEEGFAVARGYYLHQGAQPVPLQTRSDHPKLNEQHRRLTQILFTPACAAMREYPRFTDLCRSTGLTAFWEESGITPDYLL
jgi:DNA-binding winged helix-turn-helix (wHTH) protein